MGFPKRFMPRRTTAHDRHTGISDVVFMSSRDGLTFRRWGEAWIRPGPPQERWINRNNFVAWGMVETESPWPGAPKEISFYSMEGYIPLAPTLERVGSMTPLLSTHHRRLYV